MMQNLHRLYRTLANPGVWVILSLVLIVPADAQDPEIRHLYVPADRLSAVWQTDRAGAVLSRQAFDELVAAVRRKTAPSLAQGASLTLASFQARLDGERLLADAEFTLHNFDPHWSIASFPLQGWNVEQAALDGASARMARRGEGDNIVDVLLESEGEHLLKLSLSAPLLAVGADRETQFDLPGAASGTFEIAVPEGKHVTLNGLRPSGVNGIPGKYRLAIGGLKSAHMRISDRHQQTRGDVLTFASTAFGVQVSPGQVTWIARTELQVVGQPVDRLVCLVPESLEITNIESSGLEAWELAESAEHPGKTIITLRYRVPFEGPKSLIMTGMVSSSPGTPWSVPYLVLENVNSHVGRVVVEHPFGVRLQLLSSRGAQPIAEATPVSDSNLSQLSYQVWQQDFELMFQAQPKEREIQAALTNILDVHERGIELHSTADFETRFAPMFDAQFLIPAAWEVTGVSLGEEPVPWEIIPREAGTNEIRVALSPPMLPGETRRIAFTALLQPEIWPVTDASQRIALPEVRLPAAGTVEALYGIVADPDLDLIPQDIVGLDPARQSDMELLNRRLISLGKQVRLGFTYQDSVFTGELEIARKPTALMVESVTFLHPGRETISTVWEAVLTVTGGGTRQLQILASESAGTDLRFQILPRVTAQQTSAQHNQQESQTAAMIYPPMQFPVIVEQTAAEPANGQRAWNLRLDRYIRGEYVLTCISQTPRTENGNIFPHQFTVQGTDQHSGYVAVESAPDQYIQVTATEVNGTPLREVDAVDFPRGFYKPRDRVVAGFHFVRPGWLMTVTDQLFDKSGVPTAVAHSAAMTSVLSSNGEFQHQGVIEFTAIGVQSLIMQLPPGAELWSTSLDGSPVEIRRIEGSVTSGETPAGISFQIPVGETTSSQRRTLEVLYATRSSELKKQSFEEQSLVAIPPVIHVRTGAGSDQPLIVLKHQWTLHHPPQALITTSQGMFEPDNPLGAETFFGALQRNMRVPAAGELGGSGLAVAIATSVLLVLGWARRLGAVKGCGVSLVEVVVIVAILGIALSLTLPSVQMARNASDRQWYAEDLAVTSGAVPLPAPDSPMPESQAPSDEAAPMDALSTMGRRFAEPSAPPAAKPVEESESLRSDLDVVNNAADAFKKEMAGVEDRARQTPGSSEFDIPFRQGSFGFASPPFGSQDGGMAGAVPGLANGTVQVAPGQAGAAAGEPAVTIYAPQTRQADDTGLPVGARGGDVAGSEIRRAAAGALLSLTMQLSVPEGSRTTTFTYQGDARETGGVPELKLKLMDRHSGSMVFWNVALGVLLVGWWLRRSTTVTKGLWFTLTVGLPMSAVLIAPLQSHLALEGVLAGGLATLVLWSLSACVRLCRPVPSVKRVSRAAVIGFAAGWLALAARPGLTQEIIVPQRTLPEGLSAEPAVIIPYTVGEDPLTADRVIVPQELFKTLWAASHPEIADTPAPPVAAIPAELLLSSQLIRDEAAADGKPAYRVRVEGRYVVQLLDGESRQVLLPIRDVALESIIADGQPAALNALQSGQLAVTLQGRGVHIIDLVFAIPADVVTTRADGSAMEEGASAGQFELTLLPVAAGTLSVAVPAGPDLQFRVNGSTGTYRVRQVEQRRSLEIPIDRGGRIAISWQPKAQVGGAMETVQIDSSSAVVVDDSGLSVNNGYLIRVRQGGLNDISFNVPAAASIRRIAGPDLAGWEQAEEANGSRLLRIFFRRTVVDETQLQVELFQALAVTEAAQQLTAPMLEPLNVTREVGSIGVYASEQYQIRPGTMTGLSQVASNSLSPPVAPQHPEGEPIFAARFTARPVSISLAVSRRLPQARAVVEHAVRVGRRKQIVASLIQWNVAEAPRKSVSIQLPENYLTIDVASGAMVDWYETTSPNGVRVLTVEFDRPRSGDVAVSLEGHFQKQPDDPLVAVDVPIPLGIAALTSSLGVWFEESYAAAETDIAGWRSQDPSDLSASIKQLQSALPQFAYRSAEATPGSIQFRLQRAEPHLSAEVITLLAASEISVDYGFTFRWKITHAGADTFSVTTPGWLAGRMEFQAPGVRQITSTTLQDGRIRWTIKLIDPVRSEYLATAAATVPAATDRRILTPELLFDVETVTGLVPLETQRQFAILVNLSPSQLVQDNPAQVESASRSDLPFIVQEELLKQAVEIARVRSGSVPVWRALPLDTKVGSQAMVITADLLTVLETDGSWRTQAVYAVRNRGRQFLPVRLPAESQLLSVIVRGQPSRTVLTTLGAETIHLVPLPQTSLADLSFEVQLIVAGRLPRKLGNVMSVSPQQVEIPVVTIVSPKESAAFGLLVAQVSWNVYVPKGLDAAPVKDVNQTNLTWNQAGASWMSTELLKLERYRADLAEMVRLSRDKSLSYSQRSQARDNLKQIELSLRKDIASDGSSSRGESYFATEKLQADNRALQEEVAKSFADFDSDSTAGFASEDPNAGKAFIIGNNLFNLAQNSAEGQELEKEGDLLQFNFRSSGAVQKGAEIVEGKILEKGAGAKGDAARGRLREQLGQQSTILGNSITGAYAGAAYGGGGFGGGLGGGVGFEGGAAGYGALGGSGGMPRGAVQQQVPGLSDGRAGEEFNVELLHRNEWQQLRLPELGQGQTDRTGRESRYFNQLDGVEWSAINPTQTNAILDLDDWEALATGKLQAAGWTSKGGLSLLMNLPVDGDALTFSKVGGDPILTLSIRPKLHWTWLLGGMWAIGWMTVVVVSFIKFFRTPSTTAALRLASNILIALGLAGFFLFPGEGRWLLFGAFVAGGLLRVATTNSLAAVAK